MSEVKSILKNVKRIELKTNHLVEGLIAGNYRSVFKGRGIEFSEVREYVPGDDIRTIDWNVTARMNHPFVKEFIEERDLDIYIAFDVSSSNDFGTQKSKKDMGHEIAASIMFSAMRNSDNVGLCLFTEKIEKFIRPAKGRRHVLKLIREMAYFTPGNKGTNISFSLINLNKIVRKRSVIFIISDFISDDFTKSLKFLKNRNDIILINMSDLNEQDIPDIGYTFLEDEETGEQMIVDTSDPEFRKQYCTLMKEKNESLQKDMKKIKVDMVNVKTDEPFHIPLRRFFRSRERRMVR